MADEVEHILEAFSKGVKDNDFKTYFKKKKDDYWDEMAEMKNISVESLLVKEKTRYDLLKDQGTCGAASKEMENIITLHAQLFQMASTNLKLSKHLTKKQVTSSTSGKSTSNDSSNKGKG